MKISLEDFRIDSPKTLTAALSLLELTSEDWLPLAGGTDLMVLLEAGKLNRRNLLNIWNVEELKGIRENPQWIEIGSLATFSQIQRNSTIKKEFPMLFEVAQCIGARAIQNRATVGGNLANASPAADSSPVFLAYDAELEMISSEGPRTLSYSNFHLGYKKVNKLPSELIKSVRLPRRKVHENEIHYFRKVGTRRAQAIAKVSFAGFFRKEKDRNHIRIAMGGVGPTVIRCIRAEQVMSSPQAMQQGLTTPIAQQLRTQLVTEIAPMDDVRSTADYRLQVCLNLLEDFSKSCGIG